MARSVGSGTQLTGTAQDEAERVAAVRRYEILDTPRDEAFDRVAVLAAHVLDAPSASVTIADRDRIWLKAVHGPHPVTHLAAPGLFPWLPAPGGVLVIPDTLADPVAASSPLVTGPPRIRFYAAAPIVTAAGHLLGAVTVTDTRPRTVTEAGVAALADLAGIVMDEMELRLSASPAVRAEHRRAEAEHRRAEAEHTARAQVERDKAAIAAFAATLQRTLLPPVLPAVPGLELACHYHPASPRDVGGDFYDVFRLDARRWGFFVGDVCGKGAAAAALSSLARYTLRAAACHCPGNPSAVLAELNNTLFLAGTGDRGPVRATRVVADTVALLGQLDGGVRDDVAVLALSVPCG